MLDGSRDIVACDSQRASRPGKKIADAGGSHQNNQSKMADEIGGTAVENISEEIQPTLRRSKRLRRPPPHLQLHQPQHQHRHWRQSNNKPHLVPEHGNDETETKETPYWRLASGDPRQRRGEQSTQQAQVNQETQQATQNDGLPTGQDKMLSRERKPWETFVIGANLGDNLSRIEHKNRQILQQKFVLEWSKKNEPGSVSTQQDVLAALTAERVDMEDNEENNLPA
jgi:hypothetical protein